MGVKYVDNFSFDPAFGFSGSSQGRHDPVPQPRHENKEYGDRLAKGGQPKIKGYDVGGVAQNAVSAAGAQAQPGGQMWPPIAQYGGPVPPGAPGLPPGGGATQQPIAQGPQFVGSTLRAPWQPPQPAAGGDRQMGPFGPPYGNPGGIMRSPIGYVPGEQGIPAMPTGPGQFMPGGPGGQPIMGGPRPPIFQPQGGFQPQTGFQPQGGGVIAPQQMGQRPGSFTPPNMGTPDPYARPPGGAIISPQRVPVTGQQPLSAANQYMMQNLIGPQMAAQRGMRPMTGGGGPTMAMKKGGHVKRYADGGSQEPQITMPLSTAANTARRIAAVGAVQGARAARGQSPVGTAPQAPARPVRPTMLPQTQVPSPQPAMAEGGKFIQDMHLKKGALHRQLGIPEGQKIPEGRLEQATHSRNPLLAKRANTAMTLKGLHKKG